MAMMLAVAASTRISAQLLQIVSPQEGSVSALRSQTVIAKGMTGFDAELYVNDVLAKRIKTRIDGALEFVGVPVPEGDVKFEVRIVNPDGSPFTSEIRSMHILGTPSALKIETDGDRVRANGKSTVKGKVRVLDQWGYEFHEGVVVTLLADSGAVLANDIDPQTPGIQTPLENGEADFEYQAGRNAGTAIVTAQLDNVKATQQVYLDTPLEPFTLVGLVTGTGGAYSRSGDASRLANDKTFVNGFNGDGRVALYARGTIGDDYLLTASFDSDRRNQSRYFRELDPDYLYSMYGDNSLLYYDVQTNRQLFAKIEKNQTYAMLGDYSTGLTGQEFTLYNRTLNGVKFGHQDNAWRLTGFGALTDRQVVQVDKRGEGLSGFYNLGYLRITPGTEKVRIETRDRYHSEVILRQEDKVRFTDYQIDYDQGTIFFKQPVPSIDQSGNPVWIVVTFEAVADKPTSYIAGGRAERDVTNGLTLGLTGVVEQQAPTNYTLMGADAKYHIGQSLSIGGEFARSQNITGSGIAYKVESSGSPLDNLLLRSFYRRVEDGFFNITQSGGSRELGTTKYGLGGQYQLFGGTKITGDYYQNKQSTLFGANTVTSLSGGTDYRLTNKLSGQLRAEDLRSETPDSSGTHAAHSTVGSAGLTYQVDERLRVTAQHERNLGPSESVVKPNATALSADYKVTKDIVIGAEERFYENGGNLATVGVSSMVSEGTQVYGKYEIGNAIAGRRNMASIGIKNSTKLPYDLTASLAYERAKDLNQRLDETPTADHTAYSAGLEYLPKEPVKASTKIEFGENSRSHKMNFFFGGDYRYQRDLSFILKYTLATDKGTTGNGFQNIYHLITGVAYRPVESNVLNLLGKFEIKEDNNHYVAPFQDYSAWIASMHAYAEPWQRIELGVKYAFKVAKEESDLSSISTHTNFILLRGDYDLTDALSFGLEYRGLFQTEANDVLSGYSAEIGYAVMKNLKMVGGYNFKGYKDRDFVASELSTQGPFVRMSFKFGEDLFGF